MIVGGMIKMTKFEVFAIFVVMFFGTIGAVVLAITLHELYHQHQFKPIEDKIMDEEVCVLSYPHTFQDFFDLKAEGGYYAFNYNATDKEAVEQHISSIRFPEFIPYLITAGILIVFYFFFIAVLIIRKNRVQEMNEIEDLCYELGEAIEK